MGGQGSGNWYRWDSKETTESQKRIDIRWFKKQGYLTPGSSGLLSWSCNGQESGSVGYHTQVNSMTLNYRYRENGGEWENVKQDIHFDRTPCNYGSFRKWFKCPRCFRRVAILYGAGKYFYCRHCYNLTYGSQQERDLDRMARKADKIRDKMGWEPGFLNGIGPKPKGMHWRTYNRLCTSHKLIERQVLSKLRWI